MANLTMGADKLELIQSILQIENKEALDKLKNYIKKLGCKEIKQPCTFTLSELKKEIAVSLDEVRSGKGISSDEMHHFFQQYQ